MEVKDKIEVGEYIRTYKGIARVVPEGRYVEIHEDKKMIYVDRNGIPCNWEFGYYVWSNEITKHSKNIIDLIEIGDIVRVYMEDDVEADGVYEDTNMFEVVGVTTDGLEVVLLGKGFILEFFPKENIRGIVTKEQFKEMEYRL